LRSFEEVLAYGPNQVFIGNLNPDELRQIPQPWYKHLLKKGNRHGLFGEIMPEEEFYGWLKLADNFDLLWLENTFVEGIKERLARHPYITPEEIKKLGSGVTVEQNRKNIENDFALPLYYGGKLVGSLKRAHEKDDTLKAAVLLENFVAKASGALVMRHLFHRSGLDPKEVDFILECSETAVGDRYNRGGGSLSKAVGEMCQCLNATGHDIRAFCAAPIHALIDAAGLVEAGIYKNVVVVGGGCQAKIGMKYASHLKHDMPILEDVLAGIAFLVTKNDGVSPIIRLDCIGKHDIGAGSSQQSIMTSLISNPLAKIGLKMVDVDKYATEMHNPEVTLPAGSGNTPYTNYKIIASLAALNKEIDKNDIEKFVMERGMPGFSPTQGHVPAAVPFFGHALIAMKKGILKRTMFVAKGSLFLGRMSQLSDGMSFLLEANSGEE
jgi:betaine reductase